MANFKHEDNTFIIARDSLSRQLFCMVSIFPSRRSLNTNIPSLLIIICSPFQTYVSDRINLLRVYDRVSCEDVSVNSATIYLSFNFTSGLKILFLKH